jgi:NADH:ubiquinone oxidoreductase subunit E
MGTACFVRGSQAILDEFEKHLNLKPGETAADAVFSLDAIRCVGACGLAPVVSVNGKVDGRVTVEDVNKIVEEYMAKDGEDHE